MQLKSITLRKQWLYIMQSAQQPCHTNEF